MAASVSCCYISAGCNQTPNCVDWGRNGLICYGACRSVALYQPEDGVSKPARVLCTCPGHKDRVNSLRWIRTTNNDAETEMVSGSVDKTAIVWGVTSANLSPKQILKGHEAAVNSVEALTIKSDKSGGHGERTLIATTSVDSSLRIWTRNGLEGEFSESQVINFGCGFALDVSVTIIPNTSIPLLACAGDDQKIYLYVEQDGQFLQSIVLHGHEDWIRGLDFTTDDSGDILLASCSQDYIIRIWRLACRDPSTANQAISIATLPMDADIKMKENIFTFQNEGSPQAYAVILESVMMGHDNWIYSVRWQPPLLTDGLRHQPMCLLSASMDKTMILWRPDTETGVWIEQVRVGEVGGNTLGLYGALFSPNGSGILAHGYHGAFHQWAYSQEKSMWEPVVTCKGHFLGVEDLAWDRWGGKYLLTVSLDQTVRLHAPWIRHGRPLCWYEIARPQVHGYDMQCIAMATRYKFASGAEEKVIRVFDSPKKFLETLCNICDMELKTELAKHQGLSSLPEGASVPALGLSNKAVFTERKTTSTEDPETVPHPNEQYPEIYFSPVTLTEPPTEEHLLQNALWPETQKLYGHGYEVFSLAFDPSGQILASTCKAAKTEHAGIILWDTESWRQICTLEGASLTVTQLEFSHDGRYLLSISRDRTWNVYVKQPENTDVPNEGPLFSRLAGLEKKGSPHSRIIWSCAWSHDDHYFITGSRDKKVMVWRRPDLTGQTSSDQSRLVSSDQPKPVAAPLELKDAVTAVDMAPVHVHNKYLVSVGLDNGLICLCSWTDTDLAESSPWQLLVKLDQNCAHHLTVKRLRFRPCQGCAGVKDKEIKVKEKWLQLASCGSDHTVKIYDIDLSKLGNG